MKVEVIPAKQLEPRHLAVWSDIVRKQPELDSPFFTPEFVQVVAAVRRDIEVALLYQDNELAGFFPFQRSRWNVALPVGVGFSEFHGVVAKPELVWSVAELLRGCGVLAWKFDHVPVSQQPFREYHKQVGNSPFMDLADGYEAYCDQRHRSGSSVIRRTARKFRKLQREYGEVAFELHDCGQSGLRKLIEWKSAQHVRTGVVDVFQCGWVTDLLRGVQRAQTDSFSGIMSVLSVGGQPIAVHLGMKTRTVAHMWYPAYNTAFGDYSPGMILFLELASKLAAAGVVRVDLGPTPQRYKQSLRSGDIAVAIGTADRYAWARVARQAWHTGRNQLRNSAIAKPAKLPAKWLFQLRQWRALH